MPAQRLYLWNRAPAIRLLLPLMAGIVGQWYVAYSLSFLLIAFVDFALLLLVISFLPLRQQFSFKSFSGGLLMLLLAVAGALLVWWNDVRNSSEWIGNHHHNWVQVTLQEPVVEKKASYKAWATIDAAGTNKV